MDRAMGVAAPPWPALLGLALSVLTLACGFDRRGLGPVEGGTFPRDGAAGADGGSGGAGNGGGGGRGGGGGGGGSIGPDAGNGEPDAHEGGTVSVMGCADGTREGYLSLQDDPRIAACAGAWSVAGLLADVTHTPLCDRQAGNTGGALTDGSGCTVADLCAEGWHVCETAQEVMDLGSDCTDAFTSPSNPV